MGEARFNVSDAPDQWIAILPALRGQLNDQSTKKKYKKYGRYAHRYTAKDKEKDEQQRTTKRLYLPDGKDRSSRKSQSGIHNP
ncbi:MAG: hypothetical protein J0I77_18910 [Rudaea sp.]|uniref:hypothetical protein n=1 Tax=unclassified Rudaea TaxID=2627037 RepID=UPI0010F9F360|nr:MULTISPECIES: hypothetical protein [unclassified Rudaea]MBN8887804.1 hypothetical protein [Rudaea sp.]MBR0346193.1 hypothetical protein [Rudaea sp.]